MKTKLSGLFALALLSTLNLQLSTCFAQNTAFTYQGRVTDNGTNFNGAGQFKFALVTSTNANHTATATANAPSGGFITGYVVTSGGNGYVAPPSVTISGGDGSGAAAHANLTGGAVTSITVDSPGNGGYTTAPTVVIAPPPADINYTTYWSNDQASNEGSEPAAAVNVSVAGGLFTVTLGDPTIPNMAAIDSALFAQPHLQLRIWFNDGVNGFVALNPAQNLTPTPYAIVAENVNASSGFSVQQNTSGAPNLIGGSPDNFVASGVVGATIAGGGATNAPSSDINPPSATNSITADFGTVSGGAINTASGIFATVGGGALNTANGVDATVSGGSFNIAGGDATVGGGNLNTASGVFSTVGGGLANTASGAGAVVGGGGVYLFDIGGGDLAFSKGTNTASGLSAMIGGGVFNVATGDLSVVGGGTNNLAGGYGSVVGGGSGNHATNNFATVPGGKNNLATGQCSFAAGQNAHATNDNSFVWCDGNPIPITSIANASVTFSASGGYRFFTGAGAGAQLLAGQTAWSVLSDRNAKKNFETVDAGAILDKLARIPMQQWNYKWEKDTDVPNIGPMAQDFKAAFYPGRDDKSISTLEFDGVELAAIQGLNQKLDEKDSEIKTLKLQNDILAQRLNELEATVKQLATQK